MVIIVEANILDYHGYCGNEFLRTKPP